MIDLRVSGALLLAAIAFSGCRDAEAQGEDFLPLIQAHFDKEPVCVAVRKFPVDSNDPWFQGNLRVLVDQGLLSEEAPPSEVSASIGPSRRFTLTQVGAGFYRPEGLPEIPRQPVLCFARRQITGIVKAEVEPPRDEDDYAPEPRKARITFSQRIVESLPGRRPSPSKPPSLPSLSSSRPPARKARSNSSGRTANGSPNRAMPSRSGMHGSSGARSSRVLPDAARMTYLIADASDFHEKWMPLFGPML
ncbi:MAG: hypothetical protein QHC89_17720 [Bosea sp. (in: a-proteobacteria)]|nr:hypothetical protein [Bosea sp. (in: a-proteobacteria)]